MCDLFIKIIELYLKNFYKNKSKIGRPNSKNLKHYIKVIHNTIKTGISWKDIKSSLHYTTYHKKFLLWNKNNIFKDVYHILIKLLRYKNILTNDIIKDLYIDSSMIKNINGSEFLGLNHYDRNRKGNKISIIITSTGIPLGMSLETSDTHDINTVENTLDDINIKIVGSRLGGDKGYISKKLKNKLKTERNIDLITYKRNNSKDKLNDSEKIFLKKRYIVENHFSWLKNNKRIRNRYDKNTINFEQTCYLGLIYLVMNKYKDLEFYTRDLIRSSKYNL